MKGQGCDAVTVERMTGPCAYRVIVNWGDATIDFQIGGGG